MNFKSSFLPALFLFLSVSCTLNFKQEKASGENVTGSKEISGVSRLKIIGVFDLRLTQSDQESLSYEGNSVMAEHLKITQEGDLLILELEEFSSDILDNSDLRVNLSVADLREFEFEGVGNIKTTQDFQVDTISIRGDGIGNLSLGLIAKEISAQLDMMGSMTLAGSADKMILDNEGIGNVDAEGLVAQVLELKSSGIGRIAVNCEKELSITVDGIGAVSYKGNPTIIKEEINGIGKVTRN